MNEVIEDLVSQYAEETAFLWSRRNLAVHSSSYRLSDLAELDERLAGHIEGLHVSGVLAGITARKGWTRLGWRSLCCCRRRRSKHATASALRGVL